MPSSPRRRSPRPQPLNTPEEVRTAIAAVFTKASRSWSTRGIARELGAMLKPCIDALERMIEEGHAADAEPLLKRIVKSAESALDRVDDSNAHFHPLCSQALVLWGRAWARIEPRKPAKLAAMVRTYAGGSGHATRDGIIPAFAEALGPEGLRILRETYEGELAALGDPTPDEAPSRSGLPIKPDFRRWSLTHALREVADALGDVDEYVALRTRDGLADRFGVDIATRMLRAGRDEEALHWLDRAEADAREGRARRRDDRTVTNKPQDPAAPLRSKVLQALGRHADAEDALWREFERYPCLDTLNEIVALVGLSRADAARERACEMAMRNSHVHDALHFLHDAKRWDDVATVVNTRTAELDGHHYWILVKVAEHLERTHPRASWHAYRSLMDAILKDGRRPAYGHAADYLLCMRKLAAPAHLEEEQRQVEEHLQAKHRLKRAFWEYVEDGE